MNDMDSVASNKVTADCCDETATTFFADEGTTSKREFTTSTPGDKVTPEMFTICDFLAKPIMLSSGIWSTADTSNTVLYSIDPGTLINNDFTTNLTAWYDKIKGFNLIRGTFVLRVSINAMPFHAGAILIHYLPNVQSVLDAGYSGFDAMHNVNLTTKTQQPSMEVLASQSSAVFEVPYISPTNWFTIPNSVGTANNTSVSWGKIYLTVLSPLATGALQDTTVDYTVYGYWKDIELAAPLVPHSMGKMKMSRKVKALPPRVSAVAAEAEDTDRTVSKALSTISLATNAMAAIPSLAPVMGPLSWASGVASGIASAFGYSKPLSDSSPMFMSNQTVRYNGVSDGIDTSIPLGLIHNNMTAIADRYTVYDGDEMSFSFLKAVPAFLSSFAFSKSSNAGTVLYTLNGTPRDLYTSGSKTVGTRTVDYRTGPPIWYLAKCFSLWRGSIKVRLKIVKTMFHTGRLQVTWTPSVLYTTNPTLTNSSYSMREIIDIRDTDEVELLLPFMVEVEYLSTGNQTLEDMVSSGKLAITVLNELRCPDTVNSSVDVLVYVCGGDDFELQAPVWESEFAYRMNTFSPHMNMSLQQKPEDHKVPRVIGSNAPILNGVDSSSKCIGEHFTSVKQLVNRMTFMNLDSITVTNATFDPWFVDNVSLTPVTGALSQPTQGGDLFSYVAKMFMYFRGSARIHVLGTRTAGFFYHCLVRAEPTTFVNSTPRLLVGFGTSNSISTSFSKSSAAGVGIANYNDGITSVSVPYYCKTPVSFVIGKNNSSTSTSASTQPIAYLQSTFNNTTASSGNNVFFRSMKDDFQFSFFIGCPPVILNYT